MRSLLSELPGVEVVAEAGDGREALRLVREKKPDIALIDISMPGLNGLEVAARIAHERPATRVIIVSMHGDDESVRRALVSGAAGYLLKNSDTSELELALRTGDNAELMGAWESARNVAGSFQTKNEPQSEVGGSETPKAA